MKKETKNTGKKASNKVAKVEVVETPIVETPIQETVVDVTTNPVKVETRGRKVDPNSPRQIRLAKMAENKAKGVDGRGRHIDPNSARQAKLAAFEAKKADGIVISRGRPKGSGKKVEVAPVEEVKGE